MEKRSPGLRHPDVLILMPQHFTEALKQGITAIMGKNICLDIPEQPLEGARRLIKQLVKGINFPRPPLLQMQ